MHIYFIFPIHMHPCADTNPKKLFERLVYELKNNQTHLCSLLNTIPKEHHVVMGRRYLMDLVNANFTIIITR